MRFLLCLLPVVFGADLRFAGNNMSGFNANGQCRVQDAEAPELATRFATDAKQLHKRLQAAIVETIPADRASMLFSPASVLMGLSMLAESTSEGARDFIAADIAPATAAAGAPPKMAEAAKAFITAVSGGRPEDRLESIAREDSMSSSGADFSPEGSFGAFKGARFGNVIQTAPGQPIKPQADSKLRGCLNADKAEGSNKAERIIRVLTGHKISPPAAIMSPVTRAAIISTIAVNGRPNGGRMEEEPMLGRPDMMEPRDEILMGYLQDNGDIFVPENEPSMSRSGAFLPRPAKHAETRDSEDGRHKIISLPADGKGELKLHMVFPKSRMDEDVRNIDPETLDRIIQSAGFPAGPRGAAGPRISVPSFKLTQSIKLNSVLKNMGLKKLVGEIKIDGLVDEELIMEDATMKAILKVGPDGVEAAVATVLKESEPARGPGAPSDEPLVNTATLTGPTKPDRPFAFVVRHEPTGTPLFAGFVENAGDRCSAGGSPFEF